MADAYRILIIDDEQSVADLFQKLLTKRGFQVTWADGGQAGLEAAKHEKPDLILLDMKMPVMDGAQTMDALQGEPETANIPIIFVSALEDRPEDVKIARQLGAQHFVNKARALDMDTFVPQITAMIEESKRQVK